MRSNPHFFYCSHCELFNDWPGHIVNFLIIKKSVDKVKEVCYTLVTIRKGNKKIMRIVRTEKIFLSQNEADTWTKFSQILEGLERESKNPDVSSLTNLVQDLLNDLWKNIEVE